MDKNELKNVTRRASLESATSSEKRDVVLDENEENDDNESSASYSDSDDVAEKIDTIEVNYKKAVKNLTEQIDTINLEITNLAKKINNIDLKISKNIHLKIEKIFSNIVEIKEENNKYTDRVSKNNLESLEKIINESTKEFDSKITNIYSYIELSRKSDTDILSKQYHHVECKFDEFNKDQLKFKEEVTKLASSDALSLITTQIKQLNSKIVDDPILSKRNLNLCASCNTNQDKNNNLANSKHNQQSEY